jgi:hypothetical protein
VKLQVRFIMLLKKKRKVSRQDKRHLADDDNKPSLGRTRCGALDAGHDVELDGPLQRSALFAALLVIAVDSHDLRLTALLSG